MPKISRKRKSCDNIEGKIKCKKKLVTIQEEFEKENLAEISNNIEIVKLTESLLDSEEEEEDCDWEDVSDIDDKRDEIVVNINDGESDSSTDIKDKKREQQKQAREKRELIHRTLLMALIGRVLFINKLCDDEWIRSLALSCLSNVPVEQKTVKGKKLRGIIGNIEEQFQIEDCEDEFGDVSKILEQSFSSKKVASAWINVVYVAILRSVGVDARLIAALYPGSRKTNVATTVGNQALLCPPTVHKASTRGKAKKSKEEMRIAFNTIHNASSIIFTMEVLDEEVHQWIPLNARHCASWGDLASVIRDHPRFIYCLAAQHDNRMKNVASKYDLMWATASRRQRLSEPLFDRIISPFTVSITTEADQHENACIRNRLIEQGIPATLSDLKGHPIFVLESHLLKYEVLYPPDATPAGWFRKKAVFLRDNVKLAHTKETWLKEAMSVKPGELPCKRVKTVSSRRKSTEKGGDPFVDLFGPWQVQTYQPPTAHDGIVPRNVFGNVDLFQPSMLPGRCSHLHLKDLDKIAAQLGIDCVPAMVGWAFSKRNISRPIHEGWVVCTDDVDILKSAWLESAKDKLAKQAEQREKIVIKRWEVFTRKLLLKERLRLEYNF